MSTRIRLEEADQTVVILVEGDYAAVQVFYGDPSNEDAEKPDVVLLFGAEGLDRILKALYQARIAIERGSVGDFFHVMTGGFGFGTEAL